MGALTLPALFDIQRSNDTDPGYCNDEVEMMRLERLGPGSWFDLSHMAERVRHRSHRPKVYRSLL